jgi:NAD(P) transhydrogenase
MGGVSVHTGTIPSKTLRETVLYLTGFTERAFYGRDYRLRERISKEDIASRVQMIVSRETQLVRSQFNRKRIAELNGTARFLDAGTLEITNGREATTVRADYVLIACGTRPARSRLIPFDGKRIVDTDQISTFSNLPREIIIGGGGVIGLDMPRCLPPSRCA